MITSTVRRWIVPFVLFVIALLLYILPLRVWIFAVASGAVILVAGTGLALAQPSLGDAARRADLGFNLLGGAVVAGAFLIIQLSIDQRIELSDKRDARRAREEEAQRQELARQRDLELTLGLQKNLTGINLDGEDLSGISLGHKSIAYAQLEETILSHAYMTETDFRSTVLIRADLSHSALGGADLSGANLYGANLTGADLIGADFGGFFNQKGFLGKVPTRNLGPISESDLRFADRLPASLGEAKLIGACLNGANLVWADLEGADLRGANLEGADLRGAGLSGALYNSSTVWPRRFNAKAAGAKLVSSDSLDHC
jgi:uncharacterized protein YjbI with pentapeptide repeats